MLRDDHPMHSEDELSSDVKVLNGTMPSASSPLSTTSSPTASAPGRASSSPFAPWAVLSVHCSLTFVNGFSWANFTVTNDETRAVFGVTDNEINWLLLVYTLVWLPMLPFALALQHRRGASACIVAGAALTAAGCIVKQIAAAGSTSDGLTAILVGQTLCGAGEVFFLPLPALISATWFPPARRATTTAAASMANALGIALSYAVNPWAVRHAANTPREGYVAMFASQLTVALVIFLASVLLPARPTIPPSPLGAPAVMPLREMALAAKALLLGNVNFVVFSLVSGMMVAYAWTVEGMLHEVLKPYGVSEEDAGIMGALFAVVGAVGQLVFGRFCSSYQRSFYRVLLSAYGASTGIVTIMAVMMAAQAQAHVAGFILIPLLGFLTTGALPAMYEFTVEMTYPTPIPVAVMLQMVISRLVASPVVNRTSSALLGNDPSKLRALLCVLFCVGGMALSVLVMAVWVRNDLRRVDAEHHEKEEGGSGDGAFSMAVPVVVGSKPLLQSRNEMDTD